MSRVYIFSVRIVYTPKYTRIFRWYFRTFELYKFRNRPDKDNNNHNNEIVIVMTINSILYNGKLFKSHSYNTEHR